MLGDRWFHVREILVYADAAVRPEKFGWPGIGFAFYTHRGVLIEAQAREGSGSARMGINCAETYAAAAALRRLHELLGPSCVVLHSDSQLVVDLINRAKSARAADLRRAFAVLQCAMDTHTWVEVVKVPSDDSTLKLADERSKEAAAHRRQRAETGFRGPAVRVTIGREQSERARLRDKKRLRQSRSVTL